MKKSGLMRAPIWRTCECYDGESQVQYALSEQRGGTSSHEAAAKILNLGSVGGHTEFDLDISDKARSASTTASDCSWMPRISW